MSAAAATSCDFCSTSRASTTSRYTAGEPSTPSADRKTRRPSCASRVIGAASNNVVKHHAASRMHAQAWRFSYEMRNRSHTSFTVDPRSFGNDPNALPSLRHSAALHSVWSRDAPRGATRFPFQRSVLGLAVAPSHLPHTEGKSRIRHACATVTHRRIRASATT